MTLEQLKEICLANNIPIVRDQTLKTMLDLIVINNYHTILEIGTAYGYSAFAMAELDCVTKITTLEKRQANYDVACTNLLDRPKVKCILEDAFEFQTKDKYDFIFIDGAKSYQEILFEKYTKHLNPNGMIFIDNIFLKKYSCGLVDLTKDQLKLVTKVQNFERYLRDLKD